MTGYTAKQVHQVQVQPGTAIRDVNPANLWWQEWQTLQQQHHQAFRLQARDQQAGTAHKANTITQHAPPSPNFNLRLAIPPPAATEVPTAKI